MITHGILAAHGTFDNLIHEMDSISEFDAKKEPKKIRWNKTKVHDNSNRGQYKDLAIYRKRWR